MLEKELEVYKRVRAELQSQYPAGGFVVIKDDKILGIWNDRGDALKEGFEKYGNVPFLVKNINEGDIPINFSRNLKFANAGISQ